MEKFNYSDPFYQAQIKNLRTDTISEQERQYALKAFVKYNDAQDQFRKVKSWRELLPELEQSIIKELNN